MFNIKFTIQLLAQLQINPVSIFITLTNLEFPIHFLFFTLTNLIQTNWS